MLLNIFIGFVMFAAVVHGLMKLSDSTSSGSLEYNNIFDFIFDIKK